MKTKQIFIISCILSIILGTLIHFVYEWSGDNLIIGLVAPVNESIWEHLKLVLLPSTLFGILIYYYLKRNSMKDKSNEYTNFWYYLSGSIIIGMVIMVMGSYLFHAIAKTDSLIMNISLYVLVMVTTFYLTYMFSQDEGLNKKLGNRNLYGSAFILFLFMAFELLTAFPFNHHIFQDAISKSYGIYHIYY